MIVEIGSNGAELLWYIEDQTKIKYNTKSPIFYFKGLEISQEEAITWINKIFDDDENYEIYRWPYYRYLGENKFELKSYFAYPPKAVCFEVLDTLFSNVRKYSKKKGQEHIYKAGMFYYTENEIRKLLFTDVKVGYFDISAYDFDATNQPFIVEITVSDGGEIYHKITSGYIPLEYKENNE